MGGKKNKGPSGPSLDEQFNSAREGYRQRARDVAAEGGGQIDVDEEQYIRNSQELAQSQARNKTGGGVDAYKQRMEAKFKAPPGAGALSRGPGSGSTNVTAVRPKQVLGEEEDAAKRSFFA